MSLFKRLFGGSSEPSTGAEPELYTEFRIFAEPIREGGGFRIAARIEKEIGGEVKTHTMIRADTLPDRDAAATASVGKAKQLIDEQGDALFG